MTDLTAGGAECAECHAPAGTVCSDVDCPGKRGRAMPAALADVQRERERQDAKWGGPAHDDEHTAAEWAQLIEDYAGWARVMAGMGSADKAERRFIQVAALAVAAVEASRRQRGA